MTSITVMLKRAKKQMLQRANKPVEKHASQPMSCRMQYYVQTKPSAEPATEKEE